MRVKRGVTKRARHKKVLKLTKGFRGAKNRLIRVAKEAAMHSGQYAYAGRRLRRRDARSNWISTITAALTQTDTKYSVFINNLKTSQVIIDRKILAEIASTDLPTFQKIVKKITK